MPATSTGLHLGTDSADLITLSGSFQHPRLVNFGKAQLPSQGTWRSQIRAEEAGGQTAGAASPQTGAAEATIPEAIKTLLTKTGIPSRRIHTAVASETVVIRYFQMPLLPAHERKMAIAFEAKKYLPFKLEELLTDFQVVIQKTDASLMRVMFFGMKKNSAAAILSLFQSAGISPLCLEPAPVSLMRLLRQTGQLAPGQVAAILSVERDTATISIAREDLLYLSRNVTILTGSETEPVSSSELFEALMNETRVSIDYYKRRFLGEPSVSKVILFGKEIEAKKLEGLTVGLSLPMEIGDPFRRIAGGKEVPPDLAVAAGLALRGLERRGGQTNLLPAEYRKELQGLVRPLVTQLVAASLLLGVGYAVSLADLRSQEQKIRTLQAQEISSPYFQRGLKMQELQALQSDRQKKEAFLQKIAQARGENVAILAEITRLLPEQSWLQQIFLEDSLGPDRQGTLPAGARRRLLRLGGGSYLNSRDRELEEINGFLASLHSSPSLQSTFSDIEINAVQRGSLEEEEVTEFRLTGSWQSEGSRR